MELEKLSSEIQKAISDEGRWATVIAEVAQYADADGAYMCSILEPEAVRSFCCSYGMPPGFEPALLAHLARSEPCLCSARDRGLLASGSLVRVEDLMPPGHSALNLHADDVVTSRNLRHGIGLVLTDERDSPLGPRCLLMLWRPLWRPAFSADEESKLALLVPHLIEALTSHWKRRGQRLAIGWDEHRLATIEQPLFLLSESGRLMYGSPSGLGILRSGRSLTLRDGHLWWGETALIECFDPAIAQPVELTSLPANGPTLQVIPLDRKQLPKPLFQWFPRIAFFVALHPSTALDSPPIDEGFALRHALTRSEIRVLIMLMTGVTPRDAAHAMSISVAAVRAHLARAFSKLGKKRRPSF